ncbi:hypothetical protein FOZ63_023014 [Perkinsus olseni]|uniref:Uncharacterized protein n=1 Tax=Perkinsus olseni TaxID=32597 RepID=A0A7J6Q3D3_PEROL|nr:hypothetical protein FOZ62_031709 [Perkinsus olseni]KAF4702692.1 hypothetical protein FOZ63_023014 [Perkinsus olseni]
MPNKQITIAGVVAVLSSPLVSLAIGTVKPDDGFPPLKSANDEFCLFDNGKNGDHREAVRISLEDNDLTTDYIACPETRHCKRFQADFYNGALLGYYPSTHADSRSGHWEDPEYVEYEGSDHIADPLESDLFVTPPEEGTADPRDFCLSVREALIDKYATFWGMCLVYREVTKITQL